VGPAHRRAARTATNNACPKCPSRSRRALSRGRHYECPGLVEPVTHEDADRLLARIGLTRVCDVDLLVFFARHPRALLTSESLAGFLGYELKQIADSLEVLMAAGLLTRTQTPAHAARMYVFAPDATSGDWLPSLLGLASTREGRLALRSGLRMKRTATDDRQRGKSNSMMKPGPRRIVASPKPRTGTE